MLTSNSRLSRDPVEQSEAIRPFLARAIILDLTPRWGLDGLRWLSIPLPDQLRAEPIEAGSEGSKAIKISSDPFQRSRAGCSPLFSAADVLEAQAGGIAPIALSAATAVVVAEVPERPSAIAEQGLQPHLQGQHLGGGLLASRTIRAPRAAASKRRRVMVRLWRPPSARAARVPCRKPSRKSSGRSPAIGPMSARRRAE
jgi:hypothetical protein